MFCISINVNHRGYFEGKQRLRQGDPISPYLFVHCMEYLGRMMKEACKHWEFKWHPKCSKMGIVHLPFADDILMSVKVDIESVLKLIQLF